MFCKFFIGTLISSLFLYCTFIILCLIHLESYDKLVILSTLKGLRNQKSAMYLNYEKREKDIGKER